MSTTAEHLKQADKAILTGNLSLARLYASLANASALERLAEGMHRMADSEEQGRAEHAANMARLAAEEAEHKERMAQRGNLFSTDRPAEDVEVLAVHPGKPNTWDANPANVDAVGSMAEALDQLDGRVIKLLSEIGEAATELGVPGVGVENQSLLEGETLRWSLMGDTGGELVIDVLRAEDCCDNDENGTPAAPEGWVTISAELLPGDGPEVAALKFRDPTGRFSYRYVNPADIASLDAMWDEAAAQLRAHRDRLARLMHSPVGAQFVDLSATPTDQ